MFSRALSCGVSCGASFSSAARTVLSSSAVAASCSRSSSSDSSLKSDSRLYTWGMGGFGMNLNKSIDPHNVPTRCPFLYPIKQIAYGENHFAVVTEGGSLFTGGKGDYGKLSHSDKGESLEYKEVESLSDIVEVQCGACHTAALTRSGQVYTWGWPGNMLSVGALGYRGSKSSSTPTLVKLPEPVKQIASGDYHMLALTVSGRVYSWGRGEFGRLGNNSSSSSYEPIEVVFSKAPADYVVKRIDAGVAFSAALLEDNTLYAWGRNESGQLGRGDKQIMDMYSMENTPTPVLGLEREKIVDFSCGDRHMVVCTEKGHVFAWGSRQWPLAHLVKGDNGSFLRETISKVFAGKDYNIALDAYGQLFSWGYGKFFCLGQGSVEKLVSPVKIDGFGPTDPLGRVNQVFTGSKNVAAISSSKKTA